jgi:predicted ArsR family transcriptional regulator
VERPDLEARVAEIATLDQPLRRELYGLLADRDDWVGRDEAAEAVGVPRSVAAFHLDKLAEAGLADVAFERPEGRRGPGAGRPAKRYRRSRREVAVSLPDRRYDLAGALLADAVSEASAAGRPVADALADAARREGRGLGTAVGDDVAAARSTQQRRDAVMATLERLGYEPRVDGDDVVLANCPFHLLAERHRSLVCGMNLDLLTGLTEGLGAADHVEPRLAPAEGMCCVRLRVA